MLDGSDPEGESMSSQEARRGDVVLIGEKVAELERARQNERVDDFMSLFMPEAVWSPPTASG
jgi:hypothetical protein